MGELRTLLARGFGVAQQDLRNVPNESGRSYTFEVPANAIAVTCALFVCPPEFGIVAKANDREVIQIANANSCIYAKTAFATSLFSEDTSQVEYALSELQPESQDAAWVATLLATGCWAIDATRVLVASDLKAVPARELLLPPRTLPFDDGACKDGDNGDPCVTNAKAAARCKGKVCSGIKAKDERLPLVVEKCTESGRDLDGLTCEHARVPVPGQSSGERQRVDLFGVCLAGECEAPCLSDDDCALLGDGLVCGKQSAPGSGMNAGQPTDPLAVISRWSRSPSFGVCRGK